MARKTNINSNVVAIMLSSGLHAYKGEGPVNHILVCLIFPLEISFWLLISQNILKKNGFDMPLGIESDNAKWKKVITFCPRKLYRKAHCIEEICEWSLPFWQQLAFHWSHNWQLKKSVEDKQNIYDVSALLVKKSNCKVTAPLCSRVALMVSRSCHPHMFRTNLVL